MGRTNPTFRDRLTRLEREWGDYRRALRREDEPHFDRLFEHARAHADACSYLNHDSPIVAVLLSVALEQEVERAALEARLDERDAELTAVCDRIEELHARLDAMAAHVDGYELPRELTLGPDQTGLGADWTDDRGDAGGGGD
jgi:hypothetical protein